MATKPIIEIEVEDGSFKKFQAAFAAYQDQLKKTPAAWRDAETAAKSAGKAFSKAADPASFAAGAATAVKLAKSLRAAGKEQEGIKRHAEATNRSFLTLGRTVFRVGKGIAGITKDLLKWGALTGVASLALGGAGLFGIDDLAGRVSGQRREAQGLGVTSGQQEALRINYGRVLDTNAVLQNIANAKANYNDRWAFNAMGVTDYAQKNPAQLAVEMAAQARKIFKEGDGSQQYAQAHGLMQFYSMNELRRLAATSPQTMAMMRKGYGADVHTMTVDPVVQREWQNLNVQLQRAGVQIETVFVRGLAPLTPELQKVSTAFVYAARELLQNPALKKAIGDFATDIRMAADYLGSKVFLQNIHRWGRNLGDMADQMMIVLRRMGYVGRRLDQGAGYFNEANKDAQNAGKWVHGKLVEGWDWLTHPRNNPGNLRAAPGMPTEGGFAVFPTQKAGLKGMAWQLHQDQHAHHLKTLSQIITSWAPPSDHNNTAAYIAHVAKWTGMNPNAPVDLDNPKTLSRVMAAMIRQEGNGRLTPEYIRSELGAKTGAAHPADAAAHHAGTTNALLNRLVKQGLIRKPSRVDVTIQGVPGSYTAQTARAMAH